MRLVKPTERTPVKGSALFSYDKAKQAAIEKKLSHYIDLTCGHFTTWELDELYSFGRPARNKFWCDRCGKWKLKKPKKKRVYPQDPLF